MDEPRSEEGRAGEPLSVLVVDDDLETRELLCELLRHSGYKPLRAYNGREAMLFLHQTAPRFVVLDLVMPEMTGWEVVRAMKEDPALAQVPVVVVTGRTLAAAGLPRSDLAAYFQKPLDVERFGRVLERLRKVVPLRPPETHG